MIKIKVRIRQLCSFEMIFSKGVVEVFPSGKVCTLCLTNLIQKSVHRGTPFIQQESSTTLTLPRASTF
jgi:hypothetical protein